MIDLVPIDETSYQAYLAWTILNYEQENMKSLTLYCLSFSGGFLLGIVL